MVLAQFNPKSLSLRRLSSDRFKWVVMSSRMMFRNNCTDDGKELCPHREYSCVATWLLAWRYKTLLLFDEGFSFRHLRNSFFSSSDCKIEPRKLGRTYPLEMNVYSFKLSCSWHFKLRADSRLGRPSHCRGVPSVPCRVLPGLQIHS